MNMNVPQRSRLRSWHRCPRLRYLSSSSHCFRCVHGVRPSILTRSDVLPGKYFPKKWHIILQYQVHRVIRSSVSSNEPQILQIGISHWSVMGRSEI